MRLCRRDTAPIAKESDNVRLIRESYAAWDRGDLDWILEHAEPDVEFHSSGLFLDNPDVYRGRDGIETLFREFFTGWAELHMDIERVVDLRDDRVLGLVTFRGVGKESGLPVEFELAHLVQLRDGRFLRTDAFPSWEEGLRAAGLADEV